jgi:hypothetical protein
MSKKRRVVTVVKEEPEGGRPRLRAFGRGTIAALSGVPLAGVKKAIRKKEFDPDSLKSTMEWITAQKSRLSFPTPKPDETPAPPASSIPVDH